jgi:hypothetical protein
MPSSQSVGFHESSIVSVCREDKKIILKLDGVHVGEETHSATIQMSGVERVTRDGIEVEDLVQESEDGEVLTLQHTNSTLHLIVEWPDFINHQHQTRSYRLAFASCEVAIH